MEMKNGNGATQNGNSFRQEEPKRDPKVGASQLAWKQQKHLITSVFINYMHAEISLSNCMGNIC